MIRAVMYAAGLPVERQLPREFLAAAGHSACGCRILSARSAYAAMPDRAQFFAGDGVAMGFWGGTLTVSGKFTGSGEELAAFAAMLGPQTVTYEKGCLPDGTLQSAGYALQQESCVCSRVLPGEEAPLVYTPQMAEQLPLREVYKVLAACNSPAFPVPAWQDFYVDLSHMRRRGLAWVDLYRHNGEPAACAVVSATAPGQAYLSALATVPGLRGTGLAAALLQGLEQPLCGRTLYLYCTPALLSFYRKQGFFHTGSLCVWKKGE